MMESSLRMIGEGTVNTEITVPDGSSREWALQKVLYVPDLTCNLVSFSKTIESVNGCFSSTALDADF